MPKLFRTLGPVPVPTQPEDIANKGYVDNISPEVLTYFRLGEIENESAGSPGTYPIRGDFGLSELFGGSTSTRYSRAPFPMGISRYGLSYQAAAISQYNNTLTAPYVMSLIRYNPVGSTPPLVVIGSTIVATGDHYVDAQLTNPLLVGTGAQDVYQWTFATQGSSQNVGSINFCPWFEFKPIPATVIKSGAYAIALEEQEKRIKELNQELKDEQWYKDLIKDLKNQLKDTKTNDTKRPSNT